jgi:hypothetical protein
MAMADIDVRTEGIRTAFAYNEAIKIDLGPVQQFLTPSGCASDNLKGCVDFRTVDRQASDELIKILTRADQLVKGLRQGAKRMADKYDQTDAEIADTMRSISPRETGLPAADDHLLLAQKVNDPPPSA